MERRHQRTLARTQAADQALDALAHLIGSLIGECHRQDGRSRDAMRFHQMSDAVRNDARLPASGAGQQQERSFDVRDSRLLLWIQTLEKIHEREEDNTILTCCASRERS
jgi:hypothetical protein